MLHAISTFKTGENGILDTKEERAEAARGGVLLLRVCLKLVSAIFYQLFYFFTKWFFKNYEKCFLFHRKLLFISRYPNFCNFFSSFRHFWKLRPLKEIWFKTKNKVNFFQGFLIILFTNIWFLKEFIACNGCFGLFSKIKKGSGAGFWCTFSTWFFHKNVPYLILYQWTKFQCHTLCLSQDIKQNVLLSFYLDRW